MKDVKNYIVALLCAGLVMAAGAAAAAIFEDENVIWQSGANQYIKYQELDTTEFGDNDHPVELDPRQIATALEALEFRSDDFFATDDDLEPVLSVNQAQRLARHLAAGLRNAEPGQDIVFAVEKSVSKLLFLQDQVVTAGRAFYKDGKLNIIIGDYDKPRHKEFERVYDSSGTISPYFFNHGRRSSSSGSLDRNLVNAAGVSNKGTNEELRKDWFVIDVQQAAAAAEQRRRQAEGGQDGVDSQAARQMRLEAAKMKKEQRELKLEMARMREQMKSGNSGSGGGKTVEERLSNLEELYEQDMISEEEYEAKRKEILGDI